jgi:glycosyltransferase involved in cell wall biosynthesis
MNGIAGLAAKYLKGRRLFLDCDDYEAGSGRFSSGWQRLGVEFFEKWLPRRAEIITTNTHFMRANLIAWRVPPERIFFLPNGVERDRFPPSDPYEVASLRTHLGLDGKKVVAFIGSLSLPSHPVDLLFEAFLRIHRSDPETALLLVGGGEDYEALKRKALAMGLGDSVWFTGRVPPERTVLYYRAVQVSVDPVYDNDAARGRSPLKLFESWACGVPFVTSDVGDRRLLAGSPLAALLARPGDPGALAEAILQVLEHPGLAETLRARGLERVADYYWDRLAIELEAIYEQAKRA